MTQTQTETLGTEKFLAEFHAIGAVQARASIAVESVDLRDPADYTAALERAYPNLRQFVDKNLYADIEKLRRPVQPMMGQAGPFFWNNITFGGGVPVGGNSQITLFQNGAFSFTGNFHDSGFPSYNDSLIWSFRSNASQTLYIVQHTGHMAGTVEPGPRDDNWGAEGPSPALAAGWNDLVSQGFSYRGDAAVNMDLGSLLNAVKQVWGAVSTVIAIL